MIHPSYVELMQVVNSDQTEIGEEPVINSRYSIVIATAKRARQIIGGDEPMIAKAGGRKPLSAAVQELYEGKVKIVGQDDTIDEMKDKKRLSEARADSVKESGQDTQDNQETGDLDEMAQADEMEEMSEM
ncbi:MAG: DNA-directed RNA polymerase subunit omega [Eubacterium sp.]|jgi:DNA-directed RNA polymerase subunit omega|nr:DNA-directed RNA polymerase subunit omega [Eubacterium sp.]